jgi:hypothetical protein
MNSIGFCAHYSPQGDWAFAYALRLATTRDIQLNIFHWLASPLRVRRDMVYADDPQSHVERVTDELKIRKDRELREYYDEKLGNFVKVGFRLCEGNEGIELARCLHRGEYDLLVMGYEHVGCDFGDQTIEEFATDFRVPVVLVGPKTPDEFHLNGLAEVILADLGIPQDCWQRVPTTTRPGE